MKRNGHKKIEVLTRQQDGFTCKIQSTPGTGDAPTRLEAAGFHEPPDGPPEKLPLEYWDSLIGDFRDEIAGQQRLLADIIAIRSKFYPDAPRETHAPRELPALLSDLRDFVQGVRDAILDSDPSAERLHAVQKIDSLVWRTTKALEEPSGVAQTVQSAVSQVANLQAITLNAAYALLHDIDTIELFRCEDCGCRDVEFSDRETKKRFTLLLDTISQALEAK